MKYRNLSLTIFLLLNLQLVFAQKEANLWYFDDYIALDFSNNPPKRLFDSEMITYEGSGSIADSSGKLLFYSQGDTIWNKEHKIMQNGIGIGGSSTLSSVSAAIIVKQPLSYRYYYVFTSDGRLSTYTKPPTKVDDGSCYSVIDMEADSGRGKVVIKKKKIVSYSAEKIAAVLHKNKKDYWIAIKQNFSDTLFIFLLTEHGLSSKVIKHQTFKDSGNVGQIKFSPDGNYLAMVNQGYISYQQYAYLYDFDNETGNIFRTRKINSFSYGLEFSPNSKNIFLLGMYNQKGLFQCKIENISDDYIMDSTNAYPILINNLRALQLAPNGIIYGTIADSFLCTIKQPNIYGADCKFEPNGIKIIKDKSDFYPIFGLPSFVASHFQSPTFIISNRCINEPTIFLLLDSLDNDSVKWDFGDSASQQKNTSSKITNLSHTYKMYGDYKVSLVTFYDNRSDTTTEMVSFKNPTPNFSASDVCDKDSVRYFNKSSSSIGPLSYNWNFGDGEISNFQSPSHLYITNGASKTFNVTLKVKQENGCTDSITKSINVNANPDSDFSYTIIQNKVDFKATQSGNTYYKWFFGNGDSSSFNDISYLYSKSGNYTACLKVTNAANCFSKTCKDILIPVGVSEIIKSIGFKIYPNPTIQNFTIEINNPKNDLSISIYDAFGKLLKILETKPLDNSFIVDLNVSNGLYLIKVKNGERIYTQKIVVNQ